MPRYFEPITKEELVGKLEDAEVCIGTHNLTPQIEKDLKKVDFDWENRDPQGFHTLDNGLTFLGGEAGGDWEYPVKFIIYWDGKKLRAYIPTEGNYFNRTLKCAYGSEAEHIGDSDNFEDEAEEAKAKDLQKHHFPDRTLKELVDAEHDLPHSRGFLNEAMEEDIKARIVKKDGMTTDAVEILKRRVAANKINDPNTLANRIESMIFYGCGDEAYELFQSACEFCYQLYGLGHGDEAETVCDWAQEMADNSKQFAEQFPEMKEDTQRGVFGYN